MDLRKYFPSQPLFLTTTEPLLAAIGDMPSRYENEATVFAHELWDRLRMEPRHKNLPLCAVGSTRNEQICLTIFGPWYSDFIRSNQNFGSSQATSPIVLAQKTYEDSKMCLSCISIRSRDVLVSQKWECIDMNSLLWHPPCLPESCTNKPECDWDISSLKS